MTKRQLLLSIISFSILPITIFSVLEYPGSLTNIIVYLQNTTFWWIIIISILLSYLLYSYSFLEKGNSKNMRVIQWYLLWNVFSFVRGMFIAENYWDWKGLIGNTFGLLIPIVAYAATNKVLLQRILSFFVKYTLPLFLFFCLIISPNVYGFYLVPISFLMLFFPVLTTRWKLVILLISLLVMTIDLGARSSVIKFGVPIFLMLIYYLRRMISVKIFELVRILFVIIPLIFFVLGVTGIFDIFNMDEYVKGDYQDTEIDSKGEKIDDDLKADTRTFIYVEVLSSAKVFNSWLIGRSPARGNLSESFGADDESGRGERLGNEVAICNIFTWTGILGVVLYLFIFYRASYLAINKSNNIFSKIVGLFIAFRWSYAWVEDINGFSLTTVFLWLTIGFCFSKSFRTMTDKDVKYWVRGILNSYNNLSIRGIQALRVRKVQKELSDNI